MIILSVTGSFVHINLNKDLSSISPIHDAQTSLFESINQGESYAILIGIEDYPNSANDLDYCVDDMQGIRALLINEMGYKPENIFSLYNSEATYGNLQSLIQHIKTQMDNNDHLFFYYSGHGDYGYIKGNTYDINIQSSHPYENDFDDYWAIHHPGADMIRVHFERVDTEEDYDYVYVGDETLIPDEGYAEDYYTGSWDGDHPYSWSYWILSDTLHIELVTDDSVNDWGFYADKYEVGYFNDSSRLILWDGLNEDQYLWGNQLDSWLDEINCKDMTIVIDACFSGGILNEINDTNRMIFTASEFNRESLEDEGNEHGLFTNQFINAFERNINSGDYENLEDQNYNGFIDWEDVFEYVKEETQKRSDELQFYHSPTYDNKLSELTIHRSNLELINSTNLDQPRLNINFSSGLYNEIESLSYNIILSDGDIIQASASLDNNNLEINGLNQFTLNYATSDATITIRGYLIKCHYVNNKVIYLFDSYNKIDSDGDSIPNVIENLLSTDQNLRDTDNDGLNDNIECKIFGTSPLDSDMDDDGLNDRLELIIYETYPFSADFDGDNLDDKAEIKYGTDSYEADTDQDGFNDGAEINAMSDPLNPTITPITKRNEIIITVVSIIIGIIAIVVIIKKVQANKAKNVSNFGNYDNSFNQNYQQFESYNYGHYSEQDESYDSPIKQRKRKQYCKYCGVPFEQDGLMKFCPNCGRKL